MHKIDLEYHIIINHIKNLLTSGILKNNEFEKINSELIKKYKPLIEEELLD